MGWHQVIGKGARPVTARPRAARSSPEVCLTCLRSRRRAVARRYASPAGRGITQPVVDQAALGSDESIPVVDRHDFGIAPGATTSPRDTLLPKLISGELRVRDTKRFAEEKA